MNTYTNTTHENNNCFDREIVISTASFIQACDSYKSQSRKEAPILRQTWLNCYRRGTRRNSVASDAILCNHAFVENI